MPTLKNPGIHHIVYLKLVRFRGDSRLVVFITNFCGGIVIQSSSSTRISGAQAAFSGGERGGAKEAKGGAAGATLKHRMQSSASENSPKGGQTGQVLMYCFYNYLFLGQLWVTFFWLLRFMYQLRCC
jgi:hypothetical protein